jgi:hypothetical protein
MTEVQVQKKTRKKIELSDEERQKRRERLAQIKERLKEMKHNEPKKQPKSKKKIETSTSSESEDEPISQSSDESETEEVVIKPPVKSKNKTIVKPVSHHNKKLKQPVHKKIVFKYYSHPTPQELYTDTKFMKEAHHIDNEKPKQVEKEKPTHDEMDDYKRFADELFGD